MRLEFTELTIHALIFRLHRARLGYFGIPDIVGSEPAENALIYVSLGCIHVVLSVSYGLKPHKESIKCDRERRSAKKLV